MVQMTQWDSFSAYLFDIDGTLLNCRDAVHYFAFCDALSTVAGRPVNLDGVVTHGNVDNGILRDAWGLAGIREELWRPRLAEMQARMGAFVESRVHEFVIEPTPGCEAMLDHLLAKGALLGVATGNLARIGRAKLAAAGVLDRFALGGYSDRFESRADVFAAALAEVRAQCGEDATVCVVGDTPEDVRAASACGLAVIAVATGIFSQEELSRESPDWCLHSFLELLRQDESASA